MPNFGTVAEVVSLAARELGLVSADIADPYASTDPNVLQMCALLTSAGREIIRKKQWTQSLKEYTFVTVQGTPTYAFPADFLRMTPQTHWNRTNRLPVGGPLSGEEWQYLKARQQNVAFNVLMRTWLQKIYIWPDTGTPGGYTIAFEYLSSYWVQAAGQLAGNKDAPTAKDDKLLFDTWLMSRALKRAWRRAKGLDTTVVEEDYETALDAVMDDDSAARVQYLSNRTPNNSTIDPLIGGQNIPLTGFGG